jgi:hypothetical protein
MKIFFFLLVLTGFVSCNDAPSKTASRPKLVSTDSNIVKHEAANPYAGVDISPMDMSYLPVDYPKMQDRPATPIARVIYSRPHKQGRKIFGSLLKYGEPWRLGANEATEIEFFKPVTIQGKTVDKGRYVLYTIPHENSWTIIFNSNLNSWGLTPDPKKDLFKFDIPSEKKNQSLEYYTMVFQERQGGADLVMAWDDVEARLPIQYKAK